MAAFSAVAMGAALALTAANTMYSVHQSKTAEGKAKKATEAQEKEQAKLKKELKEKEKLDALAYERDSKRARQRQSQIAAQSQNKGGTVLTGPWGLGTDSSKGSKTMLGT